MKLTSFQKLATISAVALGVAAYAVGSNAAPIQIGDPVTVPVNATVENTIDVTVTNPVRFGTIGSMGDLVDTATMSLNPDDTFTDDAGNGFGNTDPASIVSSPATPPAAADIDVTGAFGSTDLFVTYDQCVNLQVGGAGRPFIISAVRDNLNLPTLGTGVAAGSFDCAAALTAGQGTTTAAGALSYQVSANITTDTSAATAYPDGLYTGSIRMYLSY